jgi:hypothetical protein
LIRLRGRRTGNAVAWVWAFVGWFLAEIVLFGKPVPYALGTALVFAMIALLIRLAVTSVVQRIVRRADDERARRG